MSLLLLLIMKSNTLLLLYMGSGEHLCLLSFNPKKSMSLHLEDKGSLFFFIDGIGLVLVLNTVTKWGEILVNCNLILFFCLLILLRLCLWNIGQEQKTSTIIVTATGENCLYFPNVNLSL